MFLGHEQPSKKDDVPPLVDNPDLYNVSSQVTHKAEFIEKYVPLDKDIYIISHSFGAKITIELLKREQFRKRIKKCYLLFPTLERIGDTPNGIFIKKIIKYLFTVTLLLSWVCIKIKKKLSLIACFERTYGIIVILQKTQMVVFIIYVC